MKYKYIVIVCFVLLLAVTLLINYSTKENKSNVITEDKVKSGFDSLGNLYSESSEGKIIYTDKGIEVIKYGDSN